MSILLTKGEGALNVGIFKFLKREFLSRFLKQSLRKQGLNTQNELFTLFTLCWHAHKAQFKAQF